MFHEPKAVTLASANDSEYFKTSKKKTFNINILLATKTNFFMKFNTVNKSIVIACPNFKVINHNDLCCLYILI